MSIYIEGWSLEDWENLLRQARIGANNAMIGELTDVEEIPPHGRLIDVDAFIKAECDHCDGACEAIPGNCLACKSSCRCDLMLDLIDAPTIIPAEEAPP